MLYGLPRKPILHGGICLLSTFCNIIVYSLKLGVNSLKSSRSFYNILLMSRPIQNLCWHQQNHIFLVFLAYSQFLIFLWTKNKWLLLFFKINHAIRATDIGRCKKDKFFFLVQKCLTPCDKLIVNPLSVFFFFVIIFCHFSPQR